MKVPSAKQHRHFHKLQKPRIVIHPENSVLCSLSEASALFNISESEFSKRFIFSGRLAIDRLHRLHIKTVDQIGQQYGFLKKRQTELRFS